MSEQEVTVAQNLHAEDDPTSSDTDSSDSDSSDSDSSITDLSNVQVVSLAAASDGKKGKTKKGGKEKKEEIWKNWKNFKIKDTRSTRSACPHYKGKKPNGAGGEDSDQNMDAKAVKKLTKKGIKYIISANAVQLSQAERLRLLAAGIEYKWMPVPDAGVPSSSQFHDAHTAWKDHTHVLFYCGWGHGRTGTYVSAVEILEGVYTTKPKHSAWRKNKVEEAEQMDALDKLWKEWKESQ